MCETPNDKLGLKQTSKLADPKHSVRCLHVLHNNFDFSETQHHERSSVIVSVGWAFRVLKQWTENSGRLLETHTVLHSGDTVDIDSVPVLCVDRTRGKVFQNKTSQTARLRLLVWLLSVH